MNITDVIRQIRENSTFLAQASNGERCCAGAAEFAQIVDKAWLKRPAAYVLPVEDDAEANVSQNGLDQSVTETISIVLDLPNVADQRGQASSALVTQARTDLFRCLLNWRPDWSTGNQGFSYAGGNLVQMDRERLHWQFRFSLKILITDEDGWQPSAEQITEISGTLIDPQTGADTPLGFVVSAQEQAHENLPGSGPNSS
ncbi:hypothetical protein [Acetobacter orientalis]|uniref:phage tail terminator protein n=1 Tax=Acetobacter orientalis TaxID=146474 RepID=UPI0039E800C9